MHLSTVIVICVVVISAALVALIIYTLLILMDVRKMLRPVDRMLNEFHGEFKPLLKDFSGISSSLNNFLARFDRITGLLLGRVDMVAQGSEKVSSYLKNFVKNPRVELQSISAGIKRGIEILFKKKGDE